MILFAIHQYCVRQWLVAYSALKLYLNKCRFIAMILITHIQLITSGIHSLRGLSISIFDFGIQNWSYNRDIICTQFCCALLCYISSSDLSGFTCSIYQYSSGLLHWHWVCRMIVKYEWSILQWASYQIREIAGCECAGNAGNVFPATNYKGNR